MGDIYVHLFNEEGHLLHDDGFIVPNFGSVPLKSDCIVAEHSREEENPSKKIIYEVLRRYIIDERHVHFLVRGRPGEYEEFDVLGGFDPANLSPRSPRQ